MGKENQLAISYKDGSRRIIQVDKDFFTPVSLFDHKIGKMVQFAARDKALSIAESCGAAPHTVQLSSDNKVVFTKVFDMNKPIVGRAFIGPKDKKGRKKELRKEFKNTAFATHIRSWEQAKGIFQEMAKEAA